MALKGEVHVKSMVWAPKISLNDGRYVIRPFECKIVGKAEGLARVRASIHTFFAIFDDEEWRIITLFVNHLDSKTKYTDLFAASCGSIGDFTDIKLGDEGYAMTRQMKHFNFPVRNLDGTFYAQVHPFDPSYFAVKVHPSGALLFTPHHSQLTLLQHLIIQSPFLKQPVQFLADIPKYWLENDGTMCLDDSHRWQSEETTAWLRKHGLHTVPNSADAVAKRYRPWPQGLGLTACRGSTPPWSRARVDCGKQIKLKCSDQGTCPKWRSQKKNPHRAQLHQSRNRRFSIQWTQKEIAR